MENHAPIFVPFLIDNCKSLSKPFILQGIYQETGVDTAMDSTANTTRETKNPGKPHATSLKILHHPFVSHWS